MIKRNGFGEVAFLVTVGILAVVVLVAFRMLVLPPWKVWKEGLEGEAELKRASYSKQILVQQAQAEVDAAVLRAQAIHTVGAAAKAFPEYRYQEFIGAFADAMHQGRINQIIYVPTEHTIPIVEAPQARVRQ